MNDGDTLATSSEFQALSTEISAFSKEIMDNYLKLSKEQRQEFLKINKEIQKGKANSEEQKVLWDKLSSIINIDYKSRTTKINDLAAVAFGKHNVSSRQLLIAMQKRVIKTTHQSLG